MSDGIYEDADSFDTTGPPSYNAEKLYMNEVPKISQQRTAQDSLRGCYCRYKLAVVLVCVLFLAVTIGVCTITVEKVQLETKFRAMTAERDELQRRICELESPDMKNIKQYAVNVSLDHDTANPYLILSADGKQVKDGDTRQNLPDTPKRFSRAAGVLGREGFSSGKLYYEVQVKGKTGWTIGVAKESINRKGQIPLAPKDGYWTIWKRDLSYPSLPSPSAPFLLTAKLQKVGVFVDYDAGLVSFYDADCWDRIYSFTNVSFTEKIYPYFSPSLNEGGKNSAPLIISPVHVCPFLVWALGV